MKKHLKSSFIILWWILSTIIIWWTIYASLSNPTWEWPTEVKAWDILTSSSWNKTQENIKFLYEKVTSLETTITSLNWAIPSKAVVSFNLSTCPTGWKLADWNNWTPNLKDKFIIWAWGSYSRWSTWGTSTITGTIGDTTLTTNQIPNHNHSSTLPSWSTTLYAFSQDNLQIWVSGGGSIRLYSGDSNSYNQYTVASSTTQSTTWNAWNWQPHTHTFTWWSNLPPYYALIYCVKD